MAQYLNDSSEEAWSQLLLNNSNPRTNDESEMFSETRSWGVREYLICLSFLVVILIICRKKAEEDDTSNQSNETDGSPIQPNEESVRDDKSKREEEKRNMILCLFQSDKNQQKITRDHFPTTKSCRTIDTSSSTSDESQTTVDEKHNKDESDSSFDEEEGLGVVMLSNMSNVKTDCENYPRSVSNMCAICLEEYHEGETIVWSSNKSCPHAFHRDCLVNYLVKVRAENEFPCPCCRRNFFFGNTEDETGNDKNDE